MSNTKSKLDNILDFGDEPTPDQNIEQQIKAFVTNCRNGYYKSFEDNDSRAVEDLESLIAQKEKQTFRNGQLDCQAAGDPTNHKFFPEAVAQQVQAAYDNGKIDGHNQSAREVVEVRIDELERMPEGLTYAELLDYFNDRIAELTTTAANQAYYDDSGLNTGTIAATSVNREEDDE